MKIHAFRLKPGQMLKDELLSYAQKHQIKAGFIITCVGAVEEITLRMAGATPDMQDIKLFSEPLEIVSLVGTLSDESAHLHIALSKKDGGVIGGHLKAGGKVYPTIEVIIGEDETDEYRREFDSQTGFNELATKQH